MLQTEAEQWVESEIEGETSIRNKVFVDPLIIGNLGFLLITVLLDVIV